MSRLVHVGLCITSPPAHDGFTLMMDINLMTMTILDDIHVAFHCWLWKPYMLAQQPHTWATEVHKHALFCHQIIKTYKDKQNNSV